MSPTHLYLLTGATRGLGLALAQRLIHPEHTLICLSRTVSETLARTAQAGNCALEQWPVDLSEGAAAAHRLRSWLEAASGRYRSATLINNAGMIPEIAPLSELEPQAIAQALRVDLEAPMALTAAFLHATVAWGVPRKLLNISSGLGRRPMASQAVYCAAKAGMDLYTRCVALEEALKPGGARVSSVAPGVIATDMQVQLRAADPASFPDRERFVELETGGLLSTPEVAAERLLAYLAREDFGNEPVADVRG